MKLSARSWQKCLVLLVCIACLPGCSSLSSLWNTWRPEAPVNTIDFSHALPKAPDDGKKVPLEQQWSPSTWAQTRQPSAPDVPPAGPVRGPADLTVYFDNDQYRLIPSEWQRLKNFAQTLRLDARTRVQISGHTDSNHAPDYNITLSKNRSETVRQWLLQWGVPASQMSLVWFGLQQPVASNATDEGRALNRRVEIRLLTPSP